MRNSRNDRYFNYGLAEANAQFGGQNHLNNRGDGLLLAGVPGKADRFF
jgi:hypothetical protein